MHASALLARLDSYQSAAVQAIRTSENPSRFRLSAVAGSGKTTTLVALICGLIQLDNVGPADIIATTFTSKAGKEMRERLESHLPPMLVPERIGTFHSLARKRLNQLSLGDWSMSRCVDVYNEGTPGAKLIWKSIVGWRRQGIHGTEKRSLDLKASADDYMLEVEILRAEGLLPSSKGARARCRESELEALHKAWTAYEEAKAALAVWDFADLLDAWLMALKEGEDNLSPRFVFVDEAQDNNVVQIGIARELARRGTLVMLGDGRQAIYGFRGASPELFVGDKEAVELPLLYNYRSGHRLVGLGNAMAPGTAPAEPNRPSRGIIDTWPCADGIEEAVRVAKAIKAELMHGAKPDDFAILVRTNFAAGAFEGALTFQNIPCVRLGGKPFFERPDVLAYVAYAILSEMDNERALERIWNRPKRYLPRNAFSKACEALDAGEGTVGALRAAATCVSGRSRMRLKEFGKDIAHFRRTEWPEQTQAIANLLLKDIPEQRSEQADEDKAAVPVVCAQIARRFPSAIAFAQYADKCAQNSLQAQSDRQTKGRVVISTVHRVKGLEWPTVFISMPKGVFPHGRSVGDEKAMQEERRLGYVAVTRARDRCVVTWPDGDMDGKREIGGSELAEIVVEYLEGE